MSYKDEWLVIEANDDIDERNTASPAKSSCFTAPWPTVKWT